MRIFILLLISMCVFAADDADDQHSSRPKDLPAWAKDLNKKFEPAYGENAPWQKSFKAHEADEKWQKLRHEAETPYFEAYETALDTFAKTASLKKMTKGTADEIADYNAAITRLTWRNKKGWVHKATDWQPHDPFFLAYATLNNDPTAYCFLWLPANRAKYCH